MRVIKTRLLTKTVELRLSWRTRLRSWRPWISTKEIQVPHDQVFLWDDGETVIMHPDHPSAKRYCGELLPSPNGLWILNDGKLELAYSPQNCADMLRPMHREGAFMVDDAWDAPTETTILEDILAAKKKFREATGGVEANGLHIPEMTFKPQCGGSGKIMYGPGLVDGEMCPGCPDCEITD